MPSQCHQSPGPQNTPQCPSSGVDDDESSIFLSSSEDNSAEVLGDADDLPRKDDVFVGLARPALPAWLNCDAADSSQPSASTSGSQRPFAAPPSSIPTNGNAAGPFLWRLFPRCIRATNEEICIAAEVTLNVAPSDCKVTVIKEGRTLPVRVDFLNDRQAAQDDDDQPSRHVRGPGGMRSAALSAAAAAARRQAANEVLRPLRSHRADSELVLIWLTPGITPGLMLIELHTLTSGYSQTAGSSQFAPSGRSVASTGALVSAWHTHLQPPGSGGTTGGPGGGPIPGTGMMTSTGQQRMGMIGGEVSDVSIVHGLRTAAPLTASLNRLRVYNLSAPSPAAGGTAGPASGNQRPGLRTGIAAADIGLRGMSSSGAMSVVVVPDAGMEAEVCALLALQHQQTPLPVPDCETEPPLAGPGPEGSIPPALRLPSASGPLEGLAPLPPQLPSPVEAHPHQQFEPPGAGIRVVREAAGPTAPLRPQHYRLVSPERMFPPVGGRPLLPATLPDALAAESARVMPEVWGEGGAGGEVDEDQDDARARERFLWDLGAWLELSTQAAAEREARARGGPREVDQTTAMPPLGRDLQLQAHQQPRLLDSQQPRLLDSQQPRLLDSQQPRLLDSQQHQRPGGTLQARTLGQQQTDQQAPQRVLWTVNPVAEGESLAAAAENMGQPVEEYYSGPGGAAGGGRGVGGAGAGNGVGQLARAALELLGFACSRGWAATSSHIVLGLMDAGHSMAAINAAVQEAHGWSALHLAVASGSPELVATTALWRSYGSYASREEAQEEWRQMMAAPGPGGLTPLHLAAVLPQPATAALDLLSSLPGETLSTWFGVSARDGCTPAHYASRAGNSHLNDHALLFLATGAAALDMVSEQELQEVLPYIGDLNLGPSSLTLTESVDCESANASHGAGGSGGGPAAASGDGSGAGRAGRGSDSETHRHASSITSAVTAMSGSLASLCTATSGSLPSTERSTVLRRVTLSPPALRQRLRVAIAAATGAADTSGSSVTVGAAAASGRDHSVHALSQTVSLRSGGHARTSPVDLEVRRPVGSSGGGDRGRALSGTWRSETSERPCGSIWASSILVSEEPGSVLHAASNACERPIRSLRAVSTMAERPGGSATAATATSEPPAEPLSSGSNASERPGGSRSSPAGNDVGGTAGPARVWETAAAAAAATTSDVPMAAARPEIAAEAADDGLKERPEGWAAVATMSSGPSAVSAQSAFTPSAQASTQPNSAALERPVGSLLATRSETSDPVVASFAAPAGADFVGPRNAAPTAADPGSGFASSASRSAPTSRSLLVAAPAPRRSASSRMTLFSRLFRNSLRCLGGGCDDAEAGGREAEGPLAQPRQRPSPPPHLQRDTGGEERHPWPRAASSSSERPGRGHAAADQPMAATAAAAAGGSVASAPVSSSVTRLLDGDVRGDNSCAGVPSAATVLLPASSQPDGLPAVAAADGQVLQSVVGAAGSAALLSTQRQAHTRVSEQQRQQQQQQRQRSDGSGALVGLNKDVAVPPRAGRVLGRLGAPSAVESAPAGEARTVPPSAQEERPQPQRHEPGAHQRQSHRQSTQKPQPEIQPQPPQPQEVRSEPHQRCSEARAQQPQPHAAPQPVAMQFAGPATTATTESSKPSHSVFFLRTLPPPQCSEAGGTSAPKPAAMSPLPSGEPWLCPRSSWRDPFLVVAGLLGRISPCDSTTVSSQGGGSIGCGAATGAVAGCGGSGSSDVAAASAGPGSSGSGPKVPATCVQGLAALLGGSSVDLQFQQPMNLDQARQTAWRLVLAAARAVASAPQTGSVTGAAHATQVTSVRAAVPSEATRNARSAPADVDARLLAGGNGPGKLADAMVLQALASQQQRQVCPAMLMKHVQRRRLGLETGHSPDTSLVQALHQASLAAGIEAPAGRAAGAPWAQQAVQGVGDWRAWTCPRDRWVPRGLGRPLVGRRTARWWRRQCGRVLLAGAALGLARAGMLRRYGLEGGGRIMTRDPLYQCLSKPALRRALVPAAAGICLALVGVLETKTSAIADQRGAFPAYVQLRSLLLVAALLCGLQIGGSCRGLAAVSNPRTHTQGYLAPAQHIQQPASATATAGAAYAWRADADGDRANGEMMTAAIVLDVISTLLLRLLPR